MKCWFLVSVFAILTTLANANSVLVVDEGNKAIYSFPANGPFPQSAGSPIVTGFDSPTVIAICSENNTAFVTDLDKIRSFSTDGPFPQTIGASIVNGILGFTNGITVSNDGTTAYVANQFSGNIYAFPTTGPFPLTIGPPLVTGLDHPVAITISKDGSTAYVACSFPGTIHSFPTAGPFPLIIDPAIVNGLGRPSSIAISKDGSTAFVTDNFGNVYSFPTAGPFPVAGSLILSGLGGSPSGITISDDGATAFVGNGSGTNVLSFPTAGPFVASSAAIGYSFPCGVAFLTVISTIETTGLSGNNLNLANYLNANAPSSVIQLFASLQNDNLNLALESASPSRNVFSTYASQTTQISLERLVNNHLGQQRWQNHKQKLSQIASLENTEMLVVDSHEIVMNKKNNQKPHQNISRCSCDKKSPLSLWLGSFGEYAKVKPKHQTPDFSTGSGGMIVAGDYSGVYPHPIGSGIAYARTHIHEDNGAGHANIDQGDVFIYGTFPIASWYFDTAVWGGYYHAKNVREISFSGYSGGKTTSKTHGWQLSPHLEIGNDQWMNWLCLESFTMVDWINNWEHRANETGTSPLNFGQHGRYCSLLRSETGLRFQEVLSFDWGTLTFMEKGSYVYQKTFHSGRVDVFLIGSPGSFIVTTLVNAQNMGIGELEVLWSSKNKSYYGNLNYQTEIGSRYQSHQGILEVGKNF